MHKEIFGSYVIPWERRNIIIGCQLSLLVYFFFFFFLRPKILRKGDGMVGVCVATDTPWARRVVVVFVIDAVVGWLAKRYPNKNGVFINEYPMYHAIFTYSPLSFTMRYTVLRRWSTVPWCCTTGHVLDLRTQRIQSLPPPPAPTMKYYPAEDRCIQPADIIKIKYDISNPSCNVLYFSRSRRKKERK